MKEMNTMKVFLEKKLPIEEIYLICMCPSKEKKEIITMLQIWEGEERVLQSMKELIKKTITDVKELTDDELEGISNYSIPNFNKITS